jgi:amino acid transporter
MIPIPYGTRYFVTLSDRANKNVRCESCHCEYVYTATYQATGSVLSFFDLLDERTCRKRAGEKARRVVEAGLAAPQIVACPACGWYQQSMARLLKRQQAKLGLQIAGGIAVLFLLAAVVAGLGGRLAAGLTLATVSIGVGVILARHFTWDPNSLPSEQKHKARAEASCGMTIAKYQAMVAAESAQRATRDAQIAAAGTAAVLAAVDGAETAASRKQARLGEQRRRRQRSLTIVSIVGIGIAAVLGAVLDASIYGAHQGEEFFSHLAIGGLIGPVLGLLCYFAAGGQGAPSGARTPAPRRTPLPLAPLVGLSVCALLSTLIAGEAAGRSTHLYLIVLGCEAGTLGAIWLYGRVTAK